MKNAVLYKTLVAGMLALGTAATTSVAQTPEQASADRARIRGADTASVWLVVVGDFTSDANRAFRREVWPLVDSLFVRPGRLRFAWVNLPSASKASQAAAEVAACSGAHSKFWSVHDVFLDEQPRWRELSDPQATLRQLAGLRGGDPIWIPECLRRGLMRGFLQADIARARGAGIRTAPAFILDNTVLSNVRTAPEFRRAIEKVLNRGR